MVLSVMVRLTVPLPRCCAHPWLQLLQLEGGVSGNPARWQHAHADMSVTNSHENITATAAQSVPSSNGWEVKNWETGTWDTPLPAGVSLLGLQRGLVGGAAKDRSVLTTASWLAVDTCPYELLRYRQGGRRAVTNLEDLPPQSCGGHWRDELRGCADSRLQAMHFTSVPLMDAYAGSLINADQFRARLQIFAVGSTRIPCSLWWVFSQKAANSVLAVAWNGLSRRYFRSSLLIRC